jgi:hypothetical protein
MIPLLSATTSGKVLLGVAAGAVGALVLRPVLVGAVRLTLDAGHAVREASHAVTGELHKIHQEAVARREQAASAARTVDAA